MVSSDTPSMLWLHIITTSTKFYQRKRLLLCVWIVISWHNSSQHENSGKVLLLLSVSLKSAPGPSKCMEGTYWGNKGGKQDRGTFWKFSLKSNTYRTFIIWARSCSYNFTRINLFNPLSVSIGKHLLCPLYIWEDWGTEELINLCKATGSNQAAWLQRVYFNHHDHSLHI